MSKNLEIALLLDFYGDLLTEKQRDMIDLYYNQDLSLAEIAQDVGISRQGVRDSIKRGEAELLHVEEALGFVKRSQRDRKLLQRIALLSQEIADLNRRQNGTVLIESRAAEIEKLIEQLLRDE